MRDPMLIVMNLRKQGVETARGAVAGAIRAEKKAAGTVQALERQIEDERRRASSLDGGDDLVEAFATWLPKAHLALATAQANQDRAVAELGRRRAELGMAQKGLEAIEMLLRRREDAARDAERRREQEAMDEAAGRCATRLSVAGAR